MVSSVSAPFCGACSRARLSSEGVLYTCLFATQGVDLRAPLYAADGSDATRAFVATVEQRVAALPRARATPVLLLCDHGRLAAAAAEALATAGFANAIVVTGGLLGEVDGGRPGWIAAGLPVVRTDAAADGPPARRGPGEGPLVRSF